jgi:dihydrofolate reductase
VKTFLIVATTADGFIAQERGQTSTQWTSKEDATWFAKRTKQAGVCIMGHTTFATINRPLPGRTVIVQTTNLDSLADSEKQYGHLTLDGNWNWVPGETEVLFTDLETGQILEKLKQGQVKELAICGGRSVYAEWMKLGLVDTLYLTKEPRLFGTGIPLFKEKLDKQLKLISVKNLSAQTLLLEYEVI